MVPSPSEIQLWDTEEVASYLEKVGLGECSHVFKKRNVNGSALMNLTEDKLLLWSQDLKVIHIRKLSRLISDLKLQLQQEKMTELNKQNNKKPEASKSEEKTTEHIKAPPKLQQTKERRISLEVRRGRNPLFQTGETNHRNSFPMVADKDISQTLVKTLLLAEERGWNNVVKLDVELKTRKKSAPAKLEPFNVFSPPPLIKPHDTSFMVCHRPSSMVPLKKKQVIDRDYEIPEPAPSVHVQNLINAAANQNPSPSSGGTVYMPVIVRTDSGPSLCQPSLKKQDTDMKEKLKEGHGESVYVTLSEEDEEDRLHRELQLVDGPSDDGYEIPDARQTSEDGHFSPLPEDLRIDAPVAFSFLTDGTPSLPPRSDKTPPPRPLPLSPKQSDEAKIDDTAKGKSGILETFKKISGSRFFPTSNQQVGNVGSGQKQNFIDKERPVITKAQISSPKVVAAPPSLPERPPLLPSRVSPNSTPPSTPRQRTKETASPVLCQQKSASGLRPLPPLPQGSQPQGEENCPPSISNPLVGKPWYQPIGRKEAEVLLRQGSNGIFLIRDSKHGGPSNPFTLSLLYESRVFHIFVRRRLDASYALGSEKEHEMKFSTIDAMVLFYQKEPLQLYCEGKPAGSTPLITWPTGA